MGYDVSGCIQNIPERSRENRIKVLGKLLYQEKVAFEARLVPRQEEKGRKAITGKK